MLRPGPIFINAVSLKIDDDIFMCLERRFLNKRDGNTDWLRFIYRFVFKFFCIIMESVYAYLLSGD